MADSITSTGDLPPCVLDMLFDGFSDESLSDVHDRSNDDVGELYIGIILYNCVQQLQNVKITAILDCWLPCR